MADKSIRATLRGFRVGVVEAAEDRDRAHLAAHPHAGGDGDRPLGGTLGHALVRPFPLKYATYSWRTRRSVGSVGPDWR